MPSYQWMIARIDAVDGRIQALTTFVATITLGVPAFGRAVGSTLPFTSPWFIGAGLVATATVLLGIVARGRGVIALPHPSKLYETSMELTKWEYQRDALFFAGEHFTANNRSLESKHRALMGMTSLFLLELACLFVWAVRA